MTSEQKRQIIELRKQGISYGVIAAELSLSRNTVASFCKRNEEGAFQTSNDAFCKCCGIEITNLPKKKKKVFCSDACRMKWWNSHKEQVNKQAFYTLVCKCCGKEFTSYGNKDRKFCSVGCYRVSQHKGGDPSE